MIISTHSLDLIERVNFREEQRLAFIIVDAKPESEPAADRSARPPGILTVLHAAATTPLENYSSDTIERIMNNPSWFDEWDRYTLDFNVRRAGCDKLAAKICRNSASASACATERRGQCYEELYASEMFRGPHPKLYPIHVRFEAIPDAAAKESLKGIGTRLQLPRREVNDLIFGPGGCCGNRSRIAIWSRGCAKRARIG